MNNPNWMTFAVGGGVGLILGYLLPSVYPIIGWLILIICAMLYENRFIKSLESKNQEQDETLKDSEFEGRLKNDNDRTS